ncbi:hypothetical protein SPRG_04031 [Saprolegnia parasitica CBS 223.65]|uniref:Uncharacterized protein n=1 Tax=Saprolegnia parasitica (strain CBS 223.65) TaxID=695850 RepID=A0A067CY10_SAPPC|nr:hypothetical protein SPRG_04031 [Saprolegnia parasitica CBS 223.65]KDO31416.1 hypothetical protein SPRG_04031 [Saprolegnia parasitica CBS 223.65]|eukprot:XP_012198011.1 hypothetical protein SPRG_04031 [Saprolegnia parasitica CBS 223.65]
MTEEVVWEWPPAPIRLVEDDGETMHLAAAGVAFLQGFEYPIGTLVVSGGPDRLRDASRVLGDGPPARDESSTAPGIYIVGSADYMQSGRCALLLDLQLPSGPSPLRAVALALASLVLHIGSGEVDAAAHLLQGLSNDTPDVAPFLPLMAWVTPSAAPVFTPSAWPDVGGRPRDAQLAKARHVCAIELPTDADDAFLSACRTNLLDALPEKRLFNVTFTGPLLVAFLDACLQPTADGALDLLSAWDHIVDLQCEPIIADALQTYRDAMDGAVTESPPLELPAYETLHDDVSRMALALFASRATFPHAPARSKAKAALWDALRRLDRDQRDSLDAHSEAFCSALCTQLWHAVTADSTLEPASALLEVSAKYHAACRGPAKHRVWSERIAADGAACFQQATAAAYAAWTDDKLANERDALDAAYKAKHATLTEHFCREKATLEARLQQEQSLQAKAHAAALARAKMENNETRRTRDELAAAQETIASLHEALRQRELEIKTANESIASLKREMVQLEAARADEAIARTALVDRLTESLQTETALRAQLDAVEAARLADVTARASMAHDAVAQLRILSEEKDMLQLKLNEFFLKASALPPAIQQHLLLPAESEPVVFADALSSFMAA